MIYTWNQRIARAEKLSAEDSPAREALAVYIKVAAFQKQVSQSLAGAEHHDVRSLLRFLPQLRTLVNELDSAPLKKTAADLGENQDAWSELLLQQWEQDPEITSASRLFIAYLLLQPYAEHVTSQMNLKAENTLRQCPACGNPAQLSVLREFNNSAKRSLVCCLCSSEWEFRRVLCPACGEQHKDKLPVFTAEEFTHARIEACDNCKSYIKCIDMSRDGYAVPPVDDLATMALDFWAQEQGYTRHHPNMFLLPGE